MTGPRNAARRLAIPSIAIVCAASMLAGIGGSTAAASASTKPAVSANQRSAQSRTRLPSRPRPLSRPRHPVGGSTVLPVGVGDPHATSSASVTFTPNTVVISPSQVSSSLRSVSADGSTYTFSNSSGKLGELAKGKVMLLEGFDAAVVTGVQHAGSSLVVSTAPAELSDIVQSGSIHVDAPPDYSDAFGTATSDASAGTSDSTAAWSPTAGGGPVEIARAAPDAPRLGAAGRIEAPGVSTLLALALQGASKRCPTASPVTVGSTPATTRQASSRTRSPSSLRPRGSRHTVVSAIRATDPGTSRGPAAGRYLSVDRSMARSAGRTRSRLST